MLKKETIELIEKTLKLDAGTISAAIENKDEVDVTITEGQLFTTDELDARDKNQKNEGIKAGKEIGYKEVRSAAGLDETTGKDPGKIAEAIKAAAVKDAKLEPNEKLKQKDEQISLLQKQLGEKDIEITGLKEKDFQRSQDSKIVASFPKNRSNSLSDEEYLLVMKSKYGYKDQDGQLVIEKDGTIMRDSKTQNPLSLSDATAQIFSERNWIEKAGGEQGGRGGGDKNSKPGMFNKKSEVIEYYEKQGKSLNGADSKEIVEKIAECAKDPAFDMNS